MFKLFDRDFFKFFMGFMLILMASFAVFYFSAELSSQNQETPATVFQSQN